MLSAWLRTGRNRGFPNSSLVADSPKPGWPDLRRLRQGHRPVHRCPCWAFMSIWPSACLGRVRPGLPCRFRYELDPRRGDHPAVPRNHLEDGVTVLLGHGVGLGADLSIGEVHGQSFTRHPGLGCWHNRGIQESSVGWRPRPVCLPRGREPSGPVWAERIAGVASRLSLGHPGRAVQELPDPHPARRHGPVHDPRPRHRGRGHPGDRPVRDRPGLPPGVSGRACHRRLAAYGGAQRDGAARGPGTPDPRPRPGARRRGPPAVRRPGPGRPAARGGRQPPDRGGLPDRRIGPGGEAHRPDPGRSICRWATARIWPMQGPP